MNIKELIEKNLKENKDYLVYDVVSDSYNFMSKERLDYIKKDFWDTTTLWKIYKIKNATNRKPRDNSTCKLSKS